MSTWTHVAATFRIDAIRPLGDREPSWDEVFGMETYEPTDYDIFGDDWRRYRESVADAEEHPDCYMPFGSEGSLHRSVWVNPDDRHMAAYVVTVFGDLRDYDDVGEIREWFTKVCGRCAIRQAVCDVRVDCWSTLAHETWCYEDVIGEGDEVADATVATGLATKADADGDA